MKGEQKKLLPGVGVDVGTANIVVTRMGEDGTFSVRHHRNMLFEIEESDESLDLIQRGDFLYAKSDGRYYIVGDDALKLANMVEGGEVIRPMKDGMLNPGLRRSRDLLFHIIKATIGEPVVEGERLRFSVPANPLDVGESTNLFHQEVLGSFFGTSGYVPRPINEALANLHSEAPKIEVEGEPAIPLSGYSVSFGAGMVNSCFAMRGKSVIEFSSTKCGDYIDKQAAMVTGEPVGKVMRIKEKSLDLSKMDASDPKVKDVIDALGVYYDEMIGRVVKAMGRELAKGRREFPGAVEVVVCGGSAMIPGFIDRMRLVVGRTDLPFKVKDIRMSKNPFFSVSQGCCLAAQADQKRTKEA